MVSRLLSLSVQASQIVFVIIKVIKGSLLYGTLLVMRKIRKIGNRLNYPVRRPELLTDNKGKSQRAIPVIVDGKVYRNGLAELERTELWLRQHIKAFGFNDIKQISYCSIRAKDRFFIDPY
ncbi:hypothetical protein AN965_16575 [Alkalicoccobacillus plakortidis]|uniref:YetF C-terminal domain-containing protein n=1 Tax=Alkalicoccobacillus plakortidis TaxID=444060 RepID=A0A9D5DN10_9BACI|nr:YetF domain-containing protein [Alkalicoccobacillus plakortidis]KQL55896.1 hypothetical protein AN965_16575 [Alkalicoccobacillus plakortidis]